MPALPSHARPLSLVLIVALGIALGFLALDSFLQHRALSSIQQAAQTITPAPAIDPASPTGYRDGLRTEILQPGDSLHWVMQTQQMVVHDTLRVRKVVYDNAPNGREAHWSSPLRWWLAFMGQVDQFVTGLPPAAAVEHAARYANPVLLGLLLVGLALVGNRYFGALPAATLVLGLATAGRLRAEFGVSLIDHHGIADVALLLSIMFLTASGTGWLRGDGAGAAPWLPGRSSARRRAIASGVCGAFALWISASTAIPVLLCIGIGGAAALWLYRGDADVGIPRSDIWRWWAVAGAAASLLFFVIEYVPAISFLRLEVNHPLYALAWLGGGELLHRIAHSRMPTSTTRVGSRAVLFASIAALCTPACVLALMGARIFSPADSFLSQLHRLSIEEFASTFATLRDKPAAFVIDYVLTQITALPLLAAPAVAGFLRRRFDAVAGTLLAIALVSALGAFVLGLYQVRWWHLSVSLWLGVLAVGAGLLLKASPAGTWTARRKVIAGIFLCAVCLPYPIEVLRHGAPLLSAPAPVSSGAAQKIVVRDLGYWLRQHAGGSAVVASSPTATTDLIYFGGHRGLGTLYWENSEGLHAIVGIHGARTSEAALQALRAAGARYWVVTSWDTFVGPPAQLMHALSQTGTPETFLFRMLSSQEPFPAWAKPLPYALPLREQQAGAWVLVFEIVAPQSKPESDTRLAQYLAATSQADAAIATLAPYANNANGPLLPLLVLADLCRERGRTADLSALGQVLLARQSEHAQLTTDDRITLARVFAALGHGDAASAIARRCASEIEASPSLGITRAQRSSLSSLLALPQGNAPR